jgi:hypothetical protein
VRIVVATALTIALVATGLLLALEIAVLIAPTPRSPAAGDRNQDIATHANGVEIRAFYAAANAILAGNGTPPATTGAAPRLPVPTQTGDAVLTHLKTLAGQGVGRLEVEGFVGDGRQVSVLVAGYRPVRTDDSPDGAGAPLWRTVDTVRLADGAIVAYAPGPIPSSPPLPLPPATLAALPGAMDVSLARIELAPEAIVSPFMAPYPHLLVVESGTLTVSGRHRVALARAGDAAFAPWPTGANDFDLVLGPGDAMLLPEGLGMMLRNENPAPVSAFSLLIAPPEALAALRGDDGNEAFTVLRMHDPANVAQPIARGDGVFTTALATTRLADGSERPRSIRVETDAILMAPGDRLPPASADQTTLVVVESGMVSVSRLAVASSEGAAHDPGEDNRVVRGGEAVALAAGSTPMLDNGSTSPAEVLLFQITVVSDGSSPVPG